MCNRINEEVTLFISFAIVFVFFCEMGAENREIESSNISFPAPFNDGDQDRYCVLLTFHGQKRE